VHDIRIRMCWPGRSGIGGWDAMGLSGTPSDMIHNLYRADQADSEITDATRTGRRFHTAGNDGFACQRLFRWAGMGNL
jgi:hypothetical protein